MSSTCWDILNIEITTDTKSIKKAYSKLLKKLDLNIDNISFIKLREAYEEALGYEYEDNDFVDDDEIFSSEYSYSQKSTELVNNDEEEEFESEESADIKIINNYVNEIFNLIKKEKNSEAIKLYLDVSKESLFLYSANYSHLEGATLGHLIEFEGLCFPYAFAEEFIKISECFNKPKMEFFDEVSLYSLNKKIESAKKFKSFLNKLDEDHKDNKELSGVDVQKLLFSPDYALEDEKQRPLVLDLLREVIDTFEMDSDFSEVDEFENKTFKQWQGELSKAPFRLSYFKYFIIGPILLRIFTDVLNTKKDYSDNNFWIAVACGILLKWGLDKAYRVYKYKRTEDGKSIFSKVNSWKVAVPSIIISISLFLFSFSIESSISNFIPSFSLFLLLVIGHKHFNILLIVISLIFLYSFSFPITEVLGESQVLLRDYYIVYICVILVMFPILALCSLVIDMDGKFSTWAVFLCFGISYFVGKGFIYYLAQFISYLAL